MTAVLCYHVYMLKDNTKLGAFIVPTGVGASIGGFAGDASGWARELSKTAKLIVNPNVVNAGCFSGINDNMLYVEGYSLDSFFKGEINLKPTQNNRIGVIFDKAIPQEILNVHINTINAVKTVYGVDVLGYEITQDEVGVEFGVDESGISTGGVNNIETLLAASKKMLEAGADALAIVCYFDTPDDADYSNGIGVDPIGGVEAILSHYISRELKVPCAHSPAFADCRIPTEIVDPRASAEYITPTFLPCVLLGLNNAPQFTTNGGIGIADLDFLVMPHDSLGSTPVFEALKRGIKVFAVEENSTALKVGAKILGLEDKIVNIESYKQMI